MLTESPRFSPPAAFSEAVERQLQQEDSLLAPYATHTRKTRGRRHPEKPHPYRPEYVRDRDRIIHSASFRRLMYKTQVFVGQPNDHQRTRLTHTLEVTQIARTVARNLSLNEDLTEAIALAHDLGHPPFGHAGERALAQCMQSHGGFEHNRHGLRLLDRLEIRYPSFAGLNLSYEVLQSMALHSHERTHPDLSEFEPSGRPPVECQVVDTCDSVAYMTHDIDDALRAELIRFSDLRTIPMWREAEERAKSSYGQLTGKQLARGVIRSLIDWQVSGLLAESERRLAPLASELDVRQAAEEVIALEPPIAAIKEQLQDFLMERVYRHPSVLRTTRTAERMVCQLFEELVRDPSPMTDKFVRRLDIEPVEQVVCDYVAGMTDRFAQRLHRELFQP